MLRGLEASSEAREVARENLARLDREHPGLAARVAIEAGDFTAPPASWLGALDVVVSNPPYVREVDWYGLEPEVRDWEPKQALVPGPSGLEVALTDLAQRVLQWLPLRCAVGTACSQLHQDVGESTECRHDDHHRLVSDLPLHDPRDVADALRVEHRGAAELENTHGRWSKRDEESVQED